MATQDEAPDLQSALSAAVAACGEVMLEMQRRKLLARPTTTRKAGEMLLAKSLTDEQLAELTSKAFELGAMALNKVGHPGVQVFRCNPSEEP